MLRGEPPVGDFSPCIGTPSCRRKKRPRRLGHRSRGQALRQCRSRLAGLSDPDPRCRVHRQSKPEAIERLSWPLTVMTLRSAAVLRDNAKNCDDEYYAPTHTKGFVALCSSPREDDE